MEKRNIILILMGVSGAGKTTIGQALAKKNKWSFFDGDDFHPEANRLKMRNKIPLTDTDRKPWLKRLRKLEDEILNREESGIIACSALKGKYRAWLSEGLQNVFFVYLKGSFELIQARMNQREGHYMPVELLKSQFAALEEPKGDTFWVIDIEKSVEEIVEDISTKINGETKSK